MTATRDALAQALSPKGLGRAFRGAAKPLSQTESQALLKETEARLRARLLELISLARRAGVLEIGMDAVISAIKTSGQGLVVVVAKDQSDRSLRMIRSALGDTELIQTASKQELGACLGRELVGVVAVRPSKLSARITGEAARLAGFEESGQSGPIARENH